MIDALPTNLVLRFGGWRAVVFLVGLGVLVAVRLTREHELPPMARESILLQLKADYARPVLQTVATTGHDRAALARRAALLVERQKVEIEQATTRGILWPKYVRVEVSVNHEPPPDRNPVRYFTIGWSGLASSEISGSKYYLHLW
ncbi:MAG: hypothetical protein QOE70_5860 [Chthoniobacter sp.]|jgi:hypothetical protein|nr:hypothetical protein [Chthoniobacter sp.]